MKREEFIECKTCKGQGHFVKLDVVKNLVKFVRCKDCDGTGAENWREYDDE